MDTCAASSRPLPAALPVGAAAARAGAAAAEVHPCRARLGYRCAHRLGRRAQGPEGPGQGLAAPGLATLAARGQALQGPALLLLRALLLPAQRDLQSSVGWRQAGPRVGGWLLQNASKQAGGTLGAS
jgi:hypothetical protein